MQNEKNELSEIFNSINNTPIPQQRINEVQSSVAPTPITYNPNMQVNNELIKGYRVLGVPPSYPTSPYYSGGYYGGSAIHQAGAAKLPSFTAKPNMTTDRVGGINADTSIAAKIMRAFGGTPKTDYIVPPHVASLARSIYVKV